MRTEWLIVLLFLCAVSSKKVKLRDREKIVKPLTTQRPKKSNSIKVEYLNVITQIQARFATTLIICKIRNQNNDRSQEATFSAVLPEAAFISNFTMLVNDERFYVGDVKNKASAQLEYDRAKSEGDTAGHVAQKPRETNTFQISINIARNSYAVFNLTYQELLKRVHGVYKHVVNLQPDQPAERMRVDVYITERGEIKNVRVPKFDSKVGEKTNKELVTATEEKNCVVTTTTKDQISNVQVTFNPPASASQVVNGQLVVLYDVERGNNGGDIEVVDGYFVHFVAPDGIKTGSKHVMFVLDTSGSMEGRKIEQLKDAMKTILSDLNSEDIFNIITFNSDVTEWKSESVVASYENVQKARQFVQQIRADGMTNLNEAILRGIELLKKSESKPLVSMIFFLTDGQPTEGEVESGTIMNNVKNANNKRFAIHCIAFGDDADYVLLQKISTKNNGLARKIFEDSDAALQLTGFYDEVRSPILTEMQVTYLDETVDVNSIVQDQHVNYYDGGEYVVIGRLKDSKTIKSSQVRAKVKGRSSKGYVELDARPAYWRCPIYDRMDGASLQFARCCPYPLEVATKSAPLLSTMVAPRGKCCWPDCCWGWYDTCLPKPPPIPDPTLPSNTLGGFVERMWAYQTIKKYLKRIELDDYSTERSDRVVGSRESYRKKALDLSLKYHFVTELTSMIIVDPKLRRIPSYFEKNKQQTETANSDRNVNFGREAGPQGTGAGSASAASEGSDDKGKKRTHNTNDGNNKLGGTTNTKQEPENAKPAPPPVKTATTTTTSPSKKGCAIDVVVVIDSSGGSINGDLVRKLVDSLASKFTSTIRMSIVVVGDSKNAGRANVVQSMVPVATNAALLKDATRKSPKSFDTDFTTSVKNAFGSSSNSPALIFLSGSQSVQYVVDGVSKVNSSNSGLKVFAVSASSGGQDAKSLAKITNSPDNVFVEPEAADLADAIKC